MNFKKKDRIFFLVSFILSLWGVGNVFYWEIWLGYPACMICKYHRFLYIALFILCLFYLYSINAAKSPYELFRKRLLEKLIILINLFEVIVSFFQLFQIFCFDLCKFVSIADKLNLILSIVILLYLILLHQIKKEIR